jgi:anthranilate phosphoribosyltransferase
MILDVLANKPGPAKDIVIFNAGVALYAADVCGSIAEGIHEARRAVESGAAQKKLAAFVAFTSAAQAT